MFSTQHALERYHHRQVGWVVIISVLLAAIVFFVIGFLPGTPMPARAMLFSFAGVLVALAWLFGTLTVTIADRAVKVRFGPGLIHKKYPLSDFVSVRVVRNKWYYGWGIRLVPKGWLYNVSGLDAVELTRKTGRVLRIGTDEPQALERALREAMDAKSA